MKEEIKTLIHISTGVSILLFVVLICLEVSVLESASYAISCGVAFSVLFNCWIWKISFLHPCVVWMPNLNGKWKCIIETTYEGKKKKVTADAIIKQTFTSIYLFADTEESNSSSKNGLLEKKIGTDEIVLTYVYENIPNVQIRERSQIHWGAVRLLVKSENQIEGEYWTDRKSLGSMTLIKVN